MFWWGVSVGVFIVIMTRDVFYPLQLSQRNGKKSRTWQYSILQCAPTASTSPPFIAVKLSVGVEVMLVAQTTNLYGRLW
jgi:hypothetical protein